MNHNDKHRSHRVGWLRASVLGANDGIVSTASLVLGVAAAGSSTSAVLLAGIAGLVAGAMSMAAGEYVSVSSQADTEAADLALEQRHLDEEPEFEHRELASIYEERGLDPQLAEQVAKQLMDHDALAAHARDELGIVDGGTAQPIQAAWTSALSFTLGASVPLLAVWLVGVWLAGRLGGMPVGAAVVLVSVIGLGSLGALAARAGGAPVVRGAMRVVGWGVLAMGVTAAVGGVVGVVV